MLRQKILSELEKKVLVYILTHELDILKRPFLKMAEALDIREEDIISILIELQKKKIIDKLRGVINHINVGYKENALVCWQVRADIIDTIKDIFIKNNLISHCYERQPQREFNYNIFTMMHAKEKEEIETFVRKVGKTFGVDYVVLFTEKELKKERLDLKSLRRKDQQ